MLSENNYIVAYHSNTKSSYWDPPKNSAVQLAAAITAAARIYMYPFISRDDCYYTDTDSVVLSQPLPSEFLSSTVLGKFKLEDRILEGYFLAPKAYCYNTIDDQNVTKFKGPAKDHVNQEWFISQFKNPSRIEQVQVSTNFRIDWSALNIGKKETLVKLGIKEGNKRIPEYNKDIWVDTQPIHIEDLDALDHMGKLIIKELKNQLQKEKKYIYK